MSVRVVARVRPLWKSERELDIIVRPGSASTESARTKKGSPEGKAAAALNDRDTLIRIPNPKNEGEQYTFQFNAVYGGDSTQQELFDAEGQWESPMDAIRYYILTLAQSLQQ